MLRLTWVQPEDLLGHELRQAALDGREPSRIAERWRAAGGMEAPLRAGASTEPASRYLRTLAEDLLDELADLPSRLKDDEPTDLEKIKSLCPNWPSDSCTSTAPPAPLAPPAPPAPARYEAAWLGRAVGCVLGKPVEKLPLEAIRQLAKSTGNWPLTTYFTARGVPQDLLTTHPWNRRSALTSLAENIDGMPEDDDLNYPLLNLLLLRRHGTTFTTTDVARLWLDELPPGRTFTAERIAHRNLLLGIEPPHTARHRNPFREWIGALIRADVHGWTNPGNPAAAAEQAHRDATLTHTANGVYAAMFTAAVIAQAATATGTHDIHTCLRTGLTVIPPNSRLARAIHHAIRLAETHDDFDTVVDELHAAHAHTHHWVHALPNTALITAALTHADGDFTGSICRAVSGGWDTDSNGATAGSIAALLTGTPAALPDRWTAPLKNRLATSVADFDGTGFDALARLTHELAHRLTPLEATRP
ncbi:MULTISPECIES: ADP-ribosylglycohydrolase family protein [unclassified Streptomyces]|uniref:ADP-ribosylglycohydrolase family protein n=1 Tax=unclassified Streptomyces TaxID=2593676 RepID=UPI002366AF23|nr:MULTISPECIES: ADP-ribosylglycohydrolase family protein [unclassified Streptomyces]MDF3148088.1 ADP-ribosylglycohydrolase family protein [Streptomyces sp. T21Q-yed]WDF37387.1 ADP-ribosylglycohydrolase family protein [Streptomyces sp. T12]